MFLRVAAAVVAGAGTAHPGQHPGKPGDAACRAGSPAPVVVASERAGRCSAVLKFVPCGSFIENHPVKSMYPGLASNGFMYDRATGFHGAVHALWFLPPCRTSNRPFICRYGSGYRLLRFDKQRCFYRSSASHA